MMAEPQGGAIGLSGRARVPLALVIDDHPLFCEALSMTLRSALDVDRVETAATLAEGLARLEKKPAPDVILLDLKLPDVDGIDGLIRLKRAAAGVPVIVVSSLAEDRVIASVVQAGASGFIPKHSQREVFIEAFDRIWAGGVYTPDGFVPPGHEGGAELDERDAVERLAQLTQQQARILQLVCEGKLNKQIAYDLDIAETTVKAHLTAILRKLNVQSRTQAVLIAQNARFAALLQRESGLS
jgi:DNA-binding NarL/FixJ family response regulator